jgi:CheY-like chemotaxis protein
MTQKKKQTGPKVLLVDDDPEVLETYRELLSQLPSQPQVVTAGSGARALALLKGDPFRLLICDLRMPRVDGLQVLATVRRRFPELRTVVITAIAGEQFRSRAYALGVDMFWLKPDTQQDMEMFLQCIESLLGQDPQGGFRGLQSKGLMDIVQMECLSQSSTLLRISRGALVGRIWIQGGELTDAETDGLRGEEAFRQILGWKSGTFENLPAEPGRERTINKPANALLLEAAQAIDEIAAPAQKNYAAAEHADQPTPAQRLAALNKRGASFIVTLGHGEEAVAEGWGTEATQELGAFMRQNFAACHDLAQQLQAGPLAHAEGLTLDHRILLLSQGDTSFLIAWPSDTDASVALEQSNQLVSSWES